MSCQQIKRIEFKDGSSFDEPWFLLDDATNRLLKRYYGLKYDVMGFSKTKVPLKRQIWLDLGEFNLFHKLEIKRIYFFSELKYGRYE